MPSDELQRAMKLGHALRGVLRINAGDPREAYVTVAGLPIDVMLRNGAESRGRSLEGDEVALSLLPLHQWFMQHNKAPPSGSAGTWLWWWCVGCRGIYRPVPVLVIDLVSRQRG